MKAGVAVRSEVNARPSIYLYLRRAGRRPRCPCARRVLNFHERRSCRSMFFCKKHHPAHLPHAAPFVRLCPVKPLLGCGDNVAASFLPDAGKVQRLP